MRRTWRDLGAVLALAVLTGALLVFALLYQREAALRSGEELTDSLSRVISEQTARTLQSVDQTLQLAGVRVDARRQAGPLDEAAARALLREHLTDLPFLRALWVVDAQGRVVMNSDPGTVGSDMRDRPYFQVYVNEPRTNFYIGPVIRSRVRGTWMMSVARPLRDRQGGVREVIAGAVEPAYFEQLWRGIDLGPNGAVALYHRSGQLLARSPANEKLLGQDFSRLPIFSEYLPRAPQGTFIRESGLDGIRRVVAYRQLPTYPDLIVAVGSGYDEMLGPWRRFAGLTGAVWAAAVLVALALTLQLRRQARRREQTEARFQMLAQAMPQVVFIAGAQGGVEFLSHRWVEITGRPVEEAFGIAWRQWVHPVDMGPLRERVEQALQRQEEVQHEFRLRHRDGSYRWQLLRAVPVRVPGSDLAWFGTATDIDKLKQAQEQLRGQAERLHMAGRLTRMGDWRADLATQRVTLSEEAATVLDMPPDAQPSLQEVFALIAPSSLPRALHALNACVDEGQPFDLEMELVTSTGRHVWLRSVGEPVKDASGKVVAIQGAQQDITLRVLMMEEIRRLNASLEERIAERTAQLSRQDALFRTLAEQAPQPFWTADPSGNVTFLSGAWYELVGGEPPDWHGSESIRLIHPDDREAARANWTRSAATGRPYTGTRRILGRDGRYHTMSYRAVPVRDERGEIALWVGVDTDITDLVANQEALRLANQQLESFSYSVSHDLQSPLQRVSSFARLLQQELPSPQAEGRAQHYLARIQANADEMAQLIEGLLALAHVSQVDIIRGTVNISDIASGILQRLQSDHPQRRVRWHVQPGLAAAGDVRLVRSMLENLVGNAWKFSARTEEAVIEVGAGAERGEFFVRDNGCGFDMAYADRLFGTFQRLHGVDEFPGTGIGLATVARAATRQGGRVWAQSAPGQGATFFFTLPPP